MNTYQVHEPRHIKEAVEMMARLENALYIAGGTKLMPLITKGKAIPKNLISLKNMVDLNNITKLNGVRLGSGLKFSQIAKSDIVKQQFTALYDAICALPLNKKNDKGTLGGDLCSGYPFAFMACPMVLFDAEVAAAGMSPATHSEGMGVKGGFFGSRIVRIESFFAGRDVKILRKDELVKDFILPFLPEHTGSVFIKIKRGKAGFFGISGIGARVSVSVKNDLNSCKQALSERSDLSGILKKLEDCKVMFEDVKIAVSYPQGVVKRHRNGENELKGNLLSPSVFYKAIQVAGVETMSGIKTTKESWYLQEILKVLLERSVMKAIDRAVRTEENISPEGAW